MRAVVIRSFGTPDVLDLDDVDEPDVGPGEALIRVRAVIVARTKDVSARSGRHPFSEVIDLPHILGAEHAGVVEDVGDGVDASWVGRRVAVSAVLHCGTCEHCARGHEEACERFELIGIHRPGAYAELTVVPVGNLWPLPDGIGFAEGAAVAGNGAVAHAQLEAGGAQRGSSVAVVGAAGALGSALVGLARHRGATVIAVDRLPEQQDALDALGVDAALDGERDDLTAALYAATDGRGVDCVIDNLGLAALWERYQPAVATLGRIVVSGSITPEPIPLRLAPLYLRSQAIIGVRTGNRRHMAAVWEEVRRGFRLPGGFVTEMPLGEVRTAHAAIETGGKRGQLVLTL